MPLQMARVLCFVQLRSIPLYRWTTVFQSAHLPTGTEAAPSLSCGALEERFLTVSSECALTHKARISVPSAFVEGGWRHLCAVTLFPRFWGDISPLTLWRKPSLMVGSRCLTLLWLRIAARMRNQPERAQLCRKHRLEEPGEGPSARRVVKSFVYSLELLSFSYPLQICCLMHTRL